MRHSSRRSFGRVRLALITCVAALVAAAGVVVTRAAASTSPAPESPAQLQVDQMTAPMTVPTAGIWLSWVTRDTRAGETQSAYEIRVATSAATATSGTAKWDSGKVTSTNPFAGYGGSGLAGYTRYWWTVRTYDAQGNPGPWATPAQFETALGGSWKTQPIWSKPVNGKNSGWAFMRGTVSVPNTPVIAATAYATATSTSPAHQYVFRLSVNGHVLGVGPAQPPSTSGANEYQAWDVTSYVKANTKDTFGALAFATSGQQFNLELIIEFQGGSRMAWGTGSGWQAMDGGSVYPSAGSIGTAYYYAPVEDLNAEKFPWGFDTPTFKATGWTSPAVKSAIGGLTPLPTANETLVQHYAQSVKLIGTNDYLIDFGTTQVGGMRLYFTNGKAGQKVTIRYGEVLASPTSVKYQLSTGNVYQDVYTLKAGTQNLTIWGYRTFRYVEVLGSPQNMTINPTQTVVDTALVYPDQPSQSAMTSSDSELNQIWSFTKNSVDALNLDPYVDPARERGVYEGDNYIHQLAQASVSGDSAEGAYSLLTALTQMAGNDPSRSITEYELIAPLAALTSYWQTGNAAGIHSEYAQLQTMLNDAGPISSSTGMVTFSTVTQLIRNDIGFAGPGSSVGQPSLDIPLTGEQPASATSPGMSPDTAGATGLPATLVDWPPSERDGFCFTSCPGTGGGTVNNYTNTVVNAFAYAAYSAMTQIAARLGKTTDEATYKADAAELASNIQTKLYDSTTGEFLDGLGVAHESMLSSVYVLAMGAATPAQAQAAAQTIATHGITTTACSVYCAAFYLDALFVGGDAQAAISTLTADTETSWQHMIDMGAGSTTEAWDPSIKGNMSYSHAWATAPSFMVPDGVFGISPLSAGWSNILIAPQPGTLTSGTFTEPTVRGQVTASFSQGSGPVTVTVTVPATATAEVAVPGLTPGQMVSVDGGTPVATTALTIPATSGLAMTAVAATAQAAGLAVVQVGSGSHTISVIS